MRVFRIDPEERLSALPVFRLISLTSFFVSIVTILVICLNSDLSFDLSYKGFNFALFTVFKVPLAFLAAGVTMLGFVAAIHRSSQTTLQIKKATEQNTFSNFYKHRQEYEDHFKQINEGFPEHISQNLSDKIIRGYYQSTFPENTPSNFKLTPRVGWLDSFDRELIEMSLILMKAHSIQHGGQSILLYSEFLRLETSLRQGLFDLNRPEKAEVKTSDGKEIRIIFWDGTKRKFSISNHMIKAGFCRIKDYAEFLSKLKYFVGEFGGTMLYGVNSYTGLSTLEHRGELDKDCHPVVSLCGGNVEELEFTKEDGDDLRKIFEDVRSSYDQIVSRLDRIEESSS